MHSTLIKERNCTSLLCYRTSRNLPTFAFFDLAVWSELDVFEQWYPTIISFRTSAGVVALTLAVLKAASLSENETITHFCSVGIVSKCAGNNLKTLLILYYGILFILLVQYYSLSRARILQNSYVTGTKTRTQYCTKLLLQYNNCSCTHCTAHSKTSLRHVRITVSFRLRGFGLAKHLNVSLYSQFWKNLGRSWLILTECFYFALLYKFIYFSVYILIILSVNHLYNPEVFLMFPPLIIFLCYWLF